MDIIGIGIMVCLGVVIAGFIGFSVTTRRIIDDQEQEIEILRRDNERLKADNIYLQRENNAYRAQITTQATGKGAKDLKQAVNIFCNRVNEMFKEW